MKRISVIFLAGLVLGALGTGAAYAAEGGMKIATIDLRKVMDLSKTGQTAKAALNQKLEEYQAKLSKKEEALLALKDEIDKKGSVWSEDVRAQKQRDFKRGVQDLDEESKDANNEMKNLEMKQFGPLVKELEGITADYGKAQGISVIFDTGRGGIAYRDENLDISAPIAAELDKRHVDDATKAESPEPTATKPAAKAARADAKR